MNRQKRIQYLQTKIDALYAKYKHSTVRSRMLEQELKILLTEK